MDLPVINETFEGWLLLFTLLENPIIYDGDDIINRISSLLRVGSKPRPF